MPEKPTRNMKTEMEARNEQSNGYVDCPNCGLKFVPMTPTKPRCSSCNFVVY